MPKAFSPPPYDPLDTHPEGLSFEDIYVETPAAFNGVPCPIMREGCYTAADERAREICTTYLDQQETKLHRENLDTVGAYDRPREDFAVRPISSLEDSFRHGGWADRRADVWHVLCQLGVSRNRLDSFRNCGSGVVVQRSISTNAVRLSGNYCRDRLCVPCANAKASEIARNLEQGTKTKLLRFLTLTLKHSETPLSAQISRIYTSFAAMRRHKFFKESVRGGAAFLEIKRSKSGAAWHVHLHCLVETDWCPKKELARAWHEVTGDSYIVDIRPINDRKDVISYVTKYATKPMEAQVYKNEKWLIECIQATKGRRTCLTFGSFRGIRLQGKAEGVTDWQTIGTLRELLQDVQRGDTWALEVWHSIHKTKEPKKLSGADPP